MEKSCMGSQIIKNLLLFNEPPIRRVVKLALTNNVHAIIAVNVSNIIYSHNYLPICSDLSQYVRSV